MDVLWVALSHGITALASGGLGAVLRCLPELFKYFQDKSDRKHELEMTKLQFEIDKYRAEKEIDKVHAQGYENEILAQINGLSEAIKTQGQLTGDKWLDRLNVSVRPVLTYWWMVLLSLYKMAVMWFAWNTADTALEFAVSFWTVNDTATIGTIISFWFMDRTFRKNSGR